MYFYAFTILHFLTNLGLVVSIFQKKVLFINNSLSLAFVYPQWKLFANDLIIKVYNILINWKSKLDKNVRLNVNLEKWEL